MSFVGIEGKRQEFIWIFTGKFGTYEGGKTQYYGIQLSFRDESGNKIKWETTDGPKHLLPPLEKNCKYRVKATVKKHDPILNMTYVTRVVILDELN